ncbi:type III secretion system low calcium response chaperone LcrH/SycD [Oxalobacteraceae bacterium GrIS 2.11]
MFQLYPMPSISDTSTDEIASREIAQEILETLGEGATLKEMAGIPDQIMDGLYAHAYDFYQKGRIADAKLFFQFLCTYDFYNADYLIGMAAVHQQQKEYAQAAHLYNLAYTLDSKNIRAKFYEGQCWLFLREKVKASECFSTVAGTKVTESLQKQAQGYLSALTPTLEEGEMHA